MPRTPAIRSGTAPVRGSVGRLRVDAPVQAFGGGEGMQQVGAGVGQLGAGIQQYAQNRQIANDKKRKISAENASFNIRQDVSRWVSEAKRRKGQEAFGIDEEFKNVSQEMIDKHTKDLDEEAKALVIMQAKNDILRYEPGVFGHERDEIERVGKNNAEAGVESTISSSVNGIGLLESFNSDYSSYRATYANELDARTESYAKAYNISGAEAKALLRKKFARDLDMRTLGALKSNIQLDETSTLEQLENNITTYKSMLQDEGLALSTSDRELLIKEADAVVAGRRAQVKSAELAAEREKTQVLLDDAWGFQQEIAPLDTEMQVSRLSVKVAMAETQREKDIYGRLLSNARADNAAVGRSISFEQRSKQMMAENETSTTLLKIDEMLKTGDSPDAIRAYVDQQFKGKKLNNDGFLKAMAKVGAKQDSRIKAVFDENWGDIKTLINKNKAMSTNLPGGTSAFKDLTIDDSQMRLRYIADIREQLYDYIAGQKGEVSRDDVEKEYKRIIKPLIEATDKDDYFKFEFPRMMFQRDIEKRKQSLKETAENILPLADQAPEARTDTDEAVNNFFERN